MRRLLWISMMSALSVSPSCAQTVYFSSPPNILVNGSKTSGPLIMGDFDRIVSDGNTAYANFLAEIATIGGQATPAQAVVAFNLSACPTGWRNADGTSGTPDMRGYFAQQFASGSTPAIGVTTQDAIQNHNHTVPGTFVSGLNFASPSLFFVTGSISFTGGVNTNMSVGNANSGNPGTETRPRNVALLYCEKN